MAATTRTATTVARKVGTAASKRAVAKRRVRVRMYRQGLGDCFLVTFNPDTAPVHLLIDCGSIGEQTTSVTLVQVAEDIATTTGNRLHVLIATHEHQDHLNGFLRAKTTFDRIAVDRVWLAWTEDATDSVARDIEKYRGDLLQSVVAAANALARKPASEPLRTGVRGMLGFVGDVGRSGAALGAKDLAKTVDEAMDWVTTRADNSDKFLMPGTVLQPSWLPGIRFYVLGPPRDKAKLNNLGEHGDENLYELTAKISADVQACATFAASPKNLKQYADGLDGATRSRLDRQLPFDPLFRTEATDTKVAKAHFAEYFRRANAWRRIDDDWLNVSGDLALQLDNVTNNTSLVLAMEFIDDGRVLLFPGDAQLGSWLSWHDHTFTVTEPDGSTREVKAADLLARTILYKVGHHASHNATARSRGLELMKRKDLVALIPLDAESAGNKWPTASWPAELVYEALCEQTRGRVIRSDTGWPPLTARPASVTPTQWRRARAAVERAHAVEVTPLYVDVSVR